MANELRTAGLALPLPCHADGTQNGEPIFIQFKSDVVPDAFPAKAMSTGIDARNTVLYVLFHANSTFKMTSDGLRAFVLGLKPITIFSSRFSPFLYVRFG